MPRILRSFVILMAAVFGLPAIVNAAVGYTLGCLDISAPFFPVLQITYSLPVVGGAT